MEGIALTYQKDGLWKTIFPFGGANDCHQVKFLRPKYSQEIPLATPKGTINITTKSPLSTTSSGANFTNFLDLTHATYGHSRLAMNQGWDDHAVLMTIENAVLSQKEATKSRWGLQGGASNQEPGYVGYSGQAVIEAEEIDISVPGFDGFPVTITEDETITIDNRCGLYAYDDNGDLRLLYDFVVHEPGIHAGRELTLVRHPDDASPEKVSVGILAKADNPEPGVVGLPCNKFIASVTADLV